MVPPFIRQPHSALPVCPDAQLHGRASGSQEEKEGEAVAHTQDTRKLLTPAAQEDTVQALVGLGRPSEAASSLLPEARPSFILLGRRSSREWLSKPFSGAAVVHHTQRSLASLGTKRLKSKCYQQAKLTKQWWRTCIIYRDKQGPY